jgi:hypothetical protein
MTSNNNRPLTFSALRSFGNNIHQELRRFNSDERGDSNVMNQVLLVAVAVIALTFIATKLFPNTFQIVSTKIGDLFGTTINIGQ